MKINNTLSEKISILRFVLMIFIVFLHMYSPSVIVLGEVIGLNDSSLYSTFIRKYISYSLGSISIPLFYVISGFLFFNNFNGKFSEFKKKYINRFKSLVIPFLFWNIVVLLFVFFIQNIQYLEVYFSGNNPKISSYNTFHVFNSIFGLTQSPVAYQFWFIRDLIVLVIISPFIYLLLKHIPSLSLLILSMIWVVNYNAVYIPSNEAIVSFYIGGYLAVKNIDFFVIKKFEKKIFIIFIVLSFFMALLHTNQLTHVLGILEIIFGVFAIFLVIDKLQKNLMIKRILINYAPTSFFIFALHEPLLTILRKISYKLFNPSNDHEVLFLYFSIPVIVICFSIFLYYLMKKHFPIFTSIITGGR